MKRTNRTKDKAKHIRINDIIQKKEKLFQILFLLSIAAIVIGLIVLGKYRFKVEGDMAKIVITTSTFFLSIILILASFYDWQWAFVLTRSSFGKTAKRIAGFILGVIFLIFSVCVTFGFI